MYQGLAFDLQQTVKAVEDAGLYESATVTFLKRTNDPADPAVSSMGQADIATFAAVTGLQNLKCMYAVWRMKPDLSAVNRTEEKFETMRERHLLLDGYFSVKTILQRYVADVTFGGETLRHEVMAVESDSQLNVTRVALRYITF